MAAWAADLAALSAFTERLAHTGTLDEALNEVVRAGAALVGARRGLVALEPADGLGPVTTVTLGLCRADVGHMETIPPASAAAGRLFEESPSHPPEHPRPAAPAPATPLTPLTSITPLTPLNGPHGGAPAPAGPPGPPAPYAPSAPHVAHADIAHEDGLDPRHREVAARVGYAASYAVPLCPPPSPHPHPRRPPRSPAAGSAHRDRLGAATWLYDEPAQPAERQRRLVALYCRYASAHLARVLELTRARAALATVGRELLTTRMPAVPGVRLAVRHRAGSHGGGHWYDALPLPDGTFGLAVGGVNGAGPRAVAAMGRLRSALRAYAVIEGEDPVAVLSDLELMLRLTEPARCATALFAYCEPGGPAPRKVVLAGAGHCPPLLIGARRAEFVETSLSAPLGMLSCWEAPSVEIAPAPGETLLLYNSGLLHHGGPPHRTTASTDHAYERLRAAAAGLPGPVRGDPDRVADHLLRTLHPEAPEEDIVLLAARFD
ncbi:PP2C family protein-serine/threonine phosphatase [Streptomyces sp. B1866]|uniref:PP2C family protein-serine/threonine phosphatase n=1 Tax=Streptomyces sp. B1866 TaxID=3075431 RepID=UPI00288E485C|nr:PP2C family protein-serine/threonine phosphatase [Streptomyces sp. B1866]MDT3399690.1 PP2C family protein-serine/threonine phosphatase [Streptomyces sp. B1866]